MSLWSKLYQLQVFGADGSEVDESEERRYQGFSLSDWKLSGAVCKVLFLKELFSV